MKRRIVQRVRTWTIDLSCWLMACNDHLCYRDLDREIGCLDHLRWWIECWLSELFTLAWEGSDEELQAVLDDEVPEEYMSDRQKAYFDTLQFED